MTIGQKIFYLLEEKKMTQKEFSDRTGIATTTISDWRKKNTNPGSDKIMVICSALEVTPEYLLSGITEDSDRGKNVDYMVLTKGTEERELIELFNDMDWLDRAHLIDYARKIGEKKKRKAKLDNDADMKKIAEFCDIEVFIDSSFSGKPSVELYYLDDDVKGSIDLSNGEIKGEFSKYIIPVIAEWYKDSKDILKDMWDKKEIITMETWE